MLVGLVGISAQAQADSKWMTNWDDALALSSKTGRPILANFTGSDWCTYCLQLHKEVFSTKDFTKWSKKVILLELDYPHGKKQAKKLVDQNMRLAKKFGIDSFPTVLYFNGKGQILGHMGYEPGGPSRWTGHANRILDPVKPTVKTVAFFEPEYPAYIKKQLYADDWRGKKAPEFEFGKILNGPLPDLKGKVVMIDFWATWCPPCRELIPEANKFAKQFKNDLVIIGVSDESEKVLSAFMKKTSFDYLVSSEPKNVMGELMKVKGIPHVMIITPDGIVRWQGFPGSDEDPLTAAKIAQIIEVSKAKSKTKSWS